MKNCLRVSSITIKNIKNVENGRVIFGGQKPLSADIIGVYGQNGSGKTALVNAFEILQDLMAGEILNEEISHYISLTKGEAEIGIVFDIVDETAVSKVFYDVKLTVAENGKLQIQSEALKTMDRKNNERTTVLFDCDFSDEEIVFTPLNHLRQLSKINKNGIPKLLAQKLYVKKQCQSLLFCDEFIKYLREVKDEEANVKLLMHIQHFARIDLFVIKNSGDGTMNIASLLPIPFKLRRIEEESKNIIYKGTAPILLGEATDIPYDVYRIIVDIIEQMNIVLSRIVPNLQIAVVNLGEHLNEDGAKVVRVEYVSKKSNYDVPLRYESEGIRKLISMLGAIINFYNRAEAVTVIDEIDAGIFEYLLGECLQVLREGGKGQLLFTSHNLRPLEKLKKENLYFTTCNTENRFVKLVYVKQNNNLRDFYYRTVQLGGQTETLYESTNLEELSIALAKAGQYVKKQEY